MGPPGAGKTTVAVELARLLGVGARDTDADVETITGRRVSDIFIDSGEAVFRQLERVAVAAALIDHSGVLAVGGGAPLDVDTRRLLAAVPVAFLDVALSAAAKRVGFDAPRPLLIDSPRAAWSRLMAERRDVYVSIADITVDTTALSPEEVAAAVAAGLGLRVRPRIEPRIDAT